MEIPLVTADPGDAVRHAEYAIEVLGDTDLTVQERSGEAQIHALLAIFEQIRTLTAVLTPQPTPPKPDPEETAERAADYEAAMAAVEASEETKRWTGPVRPRLGPDGSVPRPDRRSVALGGRFPEQPRRNDAGAADVAQGLEHPRRAADHSRPQARRADDRRAGLAVSEELEFMRRLAEQVWAATRKLGLEETCCIACARIAGQVCDYFGIRNRPQPVSAVAFNQTAARCVETGTPVPEWPSEASSVGADGARPGTVGHVVLLADIGGGRCLLDPSLPQFHRPHRQIFTAPFAHWAPDGWPDVGKGATYEAETGTVVSYWPVRNELFKTSTDWRHWRQRYRSAVGGVIRAVKSDRPVA
jgi:hypothetical protein